MFNLSQDSHAAQIPMSSTPPPSPVNAQHPPLTKSTELASAAQPLVSGQAASASSVIAEKYIASKNNNAFVTPHHPMLMPMEIVLPVLLPEYGTPTPFNALSVKTDSPSTTPPFYVSAQPTHHTSTVSTNVLLVPNQENGILTL